MKIVVTDAHAVNPGDLSWGLIERFGSVRCYEHSPQDTVLERIESADIILVNKTPITNEIIDACADLKLICVTATGYNNVDIEAATRHGIIVCNAADYSSRSVAQHVLACVLHIYNNISYYAETVRKGRWSRNRDFTYFDHPIEEIYSKNLGLIGFGSIGQETASIFAALGANILVQEHPLKKLSIPEDYRLVSKDDLLAESDIISLHIPLRSSTAGMVDYAFLRSMKQEAILINTARGPIVDEKALVKALQHNEIRAAAIDVMTSEPPKYSKLFELQNCIVTPHQAWTSVQARTKLMEITYNNIEGYLNGKIQNQVN